MLLSFLLQKMVFLMNCLMAEAKGFLAAKGLHRLSLWSGQEQLFVLEVVSCKGLDVHRSASRGL